MNRCDKGAIARLALPLAVAFVLWGIMFGLRWGNFWLLMSISAGALALWAAVWDRARLSKLLFWRWRWFPTGFALAALLYGVFWLGNWVAGRVFPFAHSQVTAIYGIKSTTDARLIALALVFLIGPAEEIFWRGFVQKQLERCWLGRWEAVVVGALIYAAVHVWSGNMMLVGAALTAGLFWGSVLAATENLWSGILSHVLWDVAVFLLWPIGG